MTLSTSRQQFLAYETQTPEDIQYGRRGGIFISTCVCVLSVISAVILAVLVGVIVYFITYYKVAQNSTAPAFWDDTEPFGASGPAADLRLPSSVVPSFYRLKLNTNLESSIFNGEVYITIRANKPVKEIILHSKNLSINGNAKLTEQIYEKVETLHTRSKRQSNETLPVESTVDSTVSKNETEVVITTTANVLAENVTETTENVTETTETTTQTVTEPPVVAVDTQVTHSSVRNIKITSITEATGDRLILKLETSLTPNVDYTLELPFSGQISNSLTGFYKSTYKNAQKQVKKLGVTQFEPTSARAAFPCFDEPAFKAMFEISIAHPENITVLSNMKVSTQENITDQPGWKWTHFDRSVNMSTYLVAYVLSDFKSLETTYTSKDNFTKPIRVWTRPELIDKAKYALNITPKLLSYYEDVFGVPYALDKLDLIAIPDFSSGAMENWGLITFRETTLLFDEADSTPRDKQNVAIDVAHELAHQWFGNLVTMKWWTDLWLNEGFATYIEYVGVEHIEPEWNMFESFGRDKMDLLRSDALKNTSPVSRKVIDASEISQKFDEISYSKGANLIRMLNHTISEELFHKGLVIYLNDWKYTNAEENDLWQAMYKATQTDPALKDLSVVEFMNTWTRQAGYPVVNVNRNYEKGLMEIEQVCTLYVNVCRYRACFTESCGPWTTELALKDLSVVEFMNTWTRQAGYPVVNVNRNYEKGLMEIEQKLFTSASDPYQKMVDQLWHIPISYTGMETPRSAWSTKPKTWLKKRFQIVSVDVNNTEALYVNVDAIGYYRVNYDQKNWELLSAALKSGRVQSPITKAQLIDDAFNLAKASQLNYSYALGLTTCVMNGEDSKIVWDLLLNNMGFLKYNLKATAGYVYFQDYMRMILKKQLEKLNYGLDKPRDDNEALLIENLLMWECNVESPRCLAWARGEFDKWMNNSEVNPIPSHLRSIVYSVALKYGSRREFDFLWNVFQSSADPTVKSLAINSLPSTREEALITLLLEKSITEIPKQYAVAVWSFEAPTGTSIAQEFLINNFDRVYNKFTQMDAFMFPAVLSGAFGFISHPEELTKLKTFASQHKQQLMPMSQTLQKLIDTAALRINWMNKYAASINQWFKDYVTKSTTLNNVNTNITNTDTVTPNIGANDANSSVTTPVPDPPAIPENPGINITEVQPSL